VSRDKPRFAGIDIVSRKKKSAVWSHSIPNWYWIASFSHPILIVSPLFFAILLHFPNFSVKSNTPPRSPLSHPYSDPFRLSVHYIVITNVIYIGEDAISLWPSRRTTQLFGSVTLPHTRQQISTWHYHRRYNLFTYRYAW